MDSVEPESFDDSELQPAVESTNPNCGTGTELIDGVCHAITSNDQPSCGTGTELRDGVCRPIQIAPDVSQDTSVFENIFGFFRNMFG